MVVIDVWGTLCEFFEPILVMAVIAAVIGAGIFILYCAWVVLRGMVGMRNMYWKMDQEKLEQARERMIRARENMYWKTEAEREMGAKNI